jgi:hypothetical protein
LFGWFSWVRGGTAAVGQVLAVVANASVILMLRHMVAAPLNYARETMASPTTLGALFPTADQASAIARFLAFIDLFVVWWLIVLATGTAVLYRQRVRSVAALFMGVYAAVALAMAGIMAALGGV